MKNKVKIDADKIAKDSIEFVVTGFYKTRFSIWIFQFGIWIAKLSGIKIKAECIKLDGK